MSVGRRAFIQLSLGGTVGILFTPVPWKLLDDASIWTQNWSWIPTLKYGEIADKPTVSKLCASGCAVKVRTVAGEAFGTEGNEANVLSGGGICPMCANSVQVKNSPNRVKAPTLKGGKTISWDEAIDMVAGKVKAAGARTAVISGDQTGTVNEVFSALLNGLGSDNFYMMPCDMQASDRAWTGLMGGSGQVGYDLEGADFVLFAGADALESWGPTVANMKAFTENGKATYVFAGPVQTRTAAVSSKWVPVPAEGMAAFTLGLAYHVLQAGKSVPAADFAQFKSMVTSGYSPAKVEAAIGVKGDVMAKLARQLLSAGNPVVVPGGSSVAAHAAAYALNLLLGGAMNILPEFPTVVENAMSRSEMLKKDVLKGVNADVLLVNEANPSFVLPEQIKAGFTVAFSLYNSETTAAADLVLPVAHSFERFDDLQSPYGVAKATYSLGTPVCKADLDVKAPADAVLAIASKAGVDLGVETFEEVLQAKVEAIGADWDELAEGAAWVSEEAAEVSGVRFAANVLGKAAVPVKGTGAVSLAPYSLLTVGTPNQATTPNAPCVISNSQLVGDTLVVMMASATAGKLGLAEGAKVKLSGGAGECEAQVRIFEGVLPGTVAAPLNMGHTVGDEFSKGKGDNIYKILTVSSEAATGASTWAGSTVNVAKI
ncbi:menaquinone reductase molybdopterin-binding-like subunit QrcB [Pseudodesulfovibrio tunisiensis]|uniref:menaquinone reductase molybdopterin-binding-like subunit QrcB n=1 Tax=Pseudodesulfovibrio tunisiensis TaxID=463192 RepID=UPI001FB44909|nr:menaquinone reductase molybdopterin-binding-like subunit QrcB [Pseudodesulfovibrio tunisiensis]